MSGLPLQMAARAAASVTSEAARQYAALPWRVGRNGTIEVLLVTSRRRGRWVVPKGWPAEGRSAAESAAREAFEEAGVIGRPGAEPIGTYSCDKLHDDGSVEPRDVTLFGLQVKGTLHDWPEKGRRKRVWRPIDDAAGLVGEPGLAALLLSLKPDLTSLPDFLRRDPRTGRMPGAEAGAAGPPAGLNPQPS